MRGILVQTRYHTGRIVDIDYSAGMVTLHGPQRQQYVDQIAGMAAVYHRDWPAVHRIISRWINKGK